MLMKAKGRMHVSQKEQVKEEMKSKSIYMLLSNPSMLYGWPYSTPLNSKLFNKGNFGAILRTTSLSFIHSKNRNFASASRVQNQSTVVMGGFHSFPHYVAVLNVSESAEGKKKDVACLDNFNEGLTFYIKQQLPSFTFWQQFICFQ